MAGNRMTHHFAQTLYTRLARRGRRLDPQALTSERRGSSAWSDWAGQDFFTARVGEALEDEWPRLASSNA